MKPINCSLILLFVLYFLSASVARAQFDYGPFTLNAFGTLGGAWLSNQHVDYTQGVQPTGPGLTHDFDIGFDSRLGAQLSIALTDTTLVTAQAVVDRQADNEFLPRLTLANIRQEIGQYLVLRVGRIQSPIFFASDYRLANFSNPWARTPGVVYDLYSLTHLDSVEFTLKHDMPFGLLSVNAGYGWLEYQFATSANGVQEDANFEINDVFYANLVLDEGPWRFKLAWLHGRASIRLDSVKQFVAGLALLDPVVVRRIDFENQSGSLYSVGFSYDNGNWLAMGEWAILQLDKESTSGDRHGGYLTIGYHFGRWLPQLTVGYQERANRRVHSTNATVDAILEQINQSSQSDYFTIALGLNYAITDSIILRGQADIIDPMKNSKGPYSNVDSSYDYGDPDVDVLLSLTLDFVF